MSRMSEQHQDLSTIHAILLGQRKVAQDHADRAWTEAIKNLWLEHVETFDNLLLEIEAAGVVWPDNVVELNAQT